jgi:hypothetical protein
MTDEIRDWLSAWSGLRQVLEEIRALDESRVLALDRYVGRGKLSGLVVDEETTRCATLFEIEEGKVKRLTHHFDRDHALTELGLA